MNKTINNVIFENKQEYFSVLQTSETLIRYLSDTESKSIEDNQIKELNFIRDNAFIGLLRNGLEYVLITEQTPNLLRLTIDNVNYDCNSEELQKILKKDYEKITGLKYTLNIQEDKNENPETLNDEIIPQPKDNENIIEKKENNNEVNTKLNIPENINNTLKESNRDEKASDEKKIENNLKEPQKSVKPAEEMKSSPHRTPVVYNSLFEAGINSENVMDNIDDVKSQNLTEKNISKKKRIWEQKKNLSSFVFNDYLLKINVPNKKEKIEQIYVFPLDLETNTSFAKFMVIVPKQETNIYISDKYGNAHIKIADIEILIKGSFSNTRFNTFIVPEGQSSKDGVVIEKTGKEHQNKNLENINNSVICYKFKKYTVFMYPLSEENNTTGNANVDMIFEKDGEYQYFHEVGNKIFEIELDENKYSPINYWKNDILFSEIF